MTAELRRAIHKALETTGGHRGQACKLVGLKMETFNEYLYHDPELRARWVGSEQKDGRPAAPIEQPTEAVTLHRPLPIEPEQKDAEAMAKEDALVRQGLKAIGIDGNKLDLVEGWRKLHGRHYKSCLEMLGGGITNQFVDIAFEIDKISREIEAGGRLGPDGEFIPMDEARETMLRIDRQKLYDLSSKFYDRAEKAGYARALLKAKANAKPEKKKPGYLAIPIQAQPGSHVVVNGGGQGDAD